MKVEELRIGNLIYNDVQDIAVKVNVTVISEQYYADKRGTECWQPIPLTEEWLVKFGFFHPKLASWYKIESFEVYIQDNIIWFDILGDSIEIKYAHQLQNLYFALTNEELKLKQND